MGLERSLGGDLVQVWIFKVLKEVNISCVVGRGIDVCLSVCEYANYRPCNDIFFGIKLRFKGKNFVKNMYTLFTSLL